MADQRSHDSGVRDYRDFGVLQRSGEVECPALQCGNRFAAGRGETEDIAGPGIELVAVDVIPKPTFPLSKIDLAQAVVDKDIRR